MSGGIDDYGCQLDGITVDLRTAINIIHGHSTSLPRTMGNGECVCSENWNRRFSY